MMFNHRQTLIDTLAAGLSSIVVPLLADQPGNATQLEKLGAGVAVIDRDARSLQSAVMRVLDDDSFRAASEKTASEISAMLSIDVAVEKMTSVVKGE